jgi:hypothetical protein
VKTEEQLDAFIKALKMKEDEHWEKLNSTGYSEFEDTDSEDCFGYKFEGLYINSEHEANDYLGMMKLYRWLKDE